MKIMLFNLHYSPNLGDGVIADCLSHGLRTAAPGAEVVSVDISGRTDPGTVTIRNRALALKALRVMPAGLRQKVVLNRLEALLDRVEPVWRAALEGADMAVIGGGQLFSDADLNFPAKIARVSGLLTGARIPVAIHAVGVSPNWSGQGAQLFNRVFDADLRAVGVRDRPSLDAWTSQAAQPAPAPRLTPDPGLLAAATYGEAPSADRRTALCVTAPEVLSYHADGAIAGRGGLGFFEALALDIANREGGVRLFCNGAAEDAAALARLARRPAVRAALAAGTAEIAPTPATPAELAATVAASRAVVAHRLHACILGYAYRRPVVGLGWDRKVKSFFEGVGLDRFFVGDETADPGHVARLAEDAIAQGMEEGAHARVVDDTRAAIAETLRRLT